MCCPSLLLSVVFVQSLIRGQQGAIYRQKEVQSRLYAVQHQTTGKQSWQLSGEFVENLEFTDVKSEH